MKKIFNLLLIASLAAFFSGCGNNQPQKKERFPSVEPMKNGKRHGTVKLYHYKTGVLEYSTDYVDGLKHGTETVYDPYTGKIKYSKHYINGVENGESTTYIYSGRILPSIEKVMVKDGKREGDLTRKSPDGKLYLITPYKDGEIHGISKRYSSDGILLEVSPYKNGQREGTTKTYHTNGKLKEIMPYKNGELSGLYSYYNLDGSLNHKQYYKNYTEQGKKQYSAAEKKKMAEEKRAKERASAMKANGGVVQLTCGGSSGSGKGAYYGMQTYVGYGSADAQNICLKKEDLHLN